MARLLLDESLSPRIADALNAAGHDAEHIVRIGLRGASDAEVFARALDDQRVLITADIGFADIRVFPGDVGVVVIRRRAGTTAAGLVEMAIERLLETDFEDLEGKVLIVEAARSRMRVRRRLSRGGEPT